MASLIMSPLKKIQEDVVSITWTRVQDEGPDKGLTHWIQQSLHGTMKQKHSVRNMV